MGEGRTSSPTRYWAMWAFPDTDPSPTPRWAIIAAPSLCRQLEIAAPFPRATVSAGLRDHLRRDLINWQIARVAVERFSV